MSSNNIIYLHIGIPKTGTTTIQSFFGRNRSELKRHGLLYPRTAASGQGDGAEHYALSNALGFHHGKKPSSEMMEKELAELGTAFELEVAESACDTVLFSSEYFYVQAPIAPIKAFFSKYNVRIIIYLRRHDFWWQSAYSQTIQTVATPPWGRSIEAYIDFSKQKSRHQGYKEIVDKWAVVFGKENIIVRPFEKQQNQPNLVCDMLSAMNIESALPLATQEAIENKNQSLPIYTLSMIDLYQRAKIAPDVRARLISNLLSKPCKHELPPTASFATPQLLAQLVEENNPDYEYIAKEYLGRKDGQLFYEPLPDPNAEWKQPRHPTFMEAIELTTEALLDVKADAP